MPIAAELKAKNVTIITFGIQSGNFAELNQLSSEPVANEHSFLLDSFAQFESLARKALHTGLKFICLTFLSFNHHFPFQLLFTFRSFVTCHRLQNRKCDSP